MKRKYKFLGSIVAITCMTATVAVSITNCSCGGGGIGDFVWTGNINKEWSTYQQMANNKFATAQSPIVDYTLGGTRTSPTDPDMIKAVSKVLGDTGTIEQREQTYCDAFMQYASTMLSQGHAIADYQFDSTPGGDVSKYNENWKNFFIANCTAAEEVDYKVSFDLTPGKGNGPALISNFHERITLAGWEQYDGEWHEFRAASDIVQIVPNAPLCEARNTWDESDATDNLDGLVNTLELSFGSINAIDYFHSKMYNNDQIYEEEDSDNVMMKFYEFYPMFYGSTFTTERI